MSVSLRGKNAIVTGAAVGIGPAYAEALDAEGVNVAVCDIRQVILELPARLEAQGVRSVGWVADVSVPEGYRLVDKFPRVETPTDYGNCPVCGAKVEKPHKAPASRLHMCSQACVMKYARNPRKYQNK